MNTHDPNEHRFIEQINALLDANTANADERKALQLARSRALLEKPKMGAPLPWMAFALSTAFAAVLVVNLPGKSPAVAKQARTQSKTPAASVTPANNNPVSTKPSTSATSALDLDLIENMELYEDAEFYQWLSEQPEQGAPDA